jgi:hypothetical protein
MKKLFAVHAETVVSRLGLEFGLGLGFQLVLGFGWGLALGFRVTFRGYE